MNKFSFIKNILDNEKFNTTQKERFLKLVSKELITSHEIGDEMLNEFIAVVETSSMKNNKKNVVENTEIEIEENQKIINERNDFSSLPIDENLISKKNEVVINKSQSEIQSKNVNDFNFEDLPKYYYPVSSYKFLFKYNQNAILKSTCHDIDSDELDIIKKYCNTDVYDFNCHLKKIIEAYEIHEKKYFAPTSLKTLFRVYLTGKNYNDVKLNGWTSDVIKINWSCEELQKWSSNNPNIPPNPSDGIVEQFENTGYEFTRIHSKVTGQHIQSFSQLVIHFKHLFHIRSDNSLRSIIERKNEVEKWNDKVDFIINDDVLPINIEHFTDIDKLIQAYKKVVLLSLEVKEKHNLEKPIIKLSASVDLEEFKFSIHHLNTEFKKSISNTKERLGQTYRNLIINQINGLCEFYLRADFGKNQLGYNAIYKEELTK